jgi:hypothetical protein
LAWSAFPLMSGHQLLLMLLVLLLLQDLKPRCKISIALVFK